MPQGYSRRLWARRSRISDTLKFGTVSVFVNGRRGRGRVSSERCAEGEGFHVAGRAEDPFLVQVLVQTVQALRPLRLYAVAARPRIIGRR